MEAAFLLFTTIQVLKDLSLFRFHYFCPYTLGTYNQSQATESIYSVKS